MVDYQKVRSIAEAEKLRMRKWVLSLLLDTEEQYLQYLNTLLLVRDDLWHSSTKQRIFLLSLAPFIIPPNLCLSAAKIGQGLF